MTRLEAYIVVNMEALIDYRMLGVLPYDLLKRVSSAVRMEQSNKAPVTRSSFFVDQAMKKYGDWLRLQDIPQLIVRTQSVKDRSEAARRGLILDGSVPAPVSVSEDIFAMDGVSSSPPVTQESPAIKRTPSKQSPGWKPIGPSIKYDSSHPFVPKPAEGPFQARYEEHYRGNREELISSNLSKRWTIGGEVDTEDTTATRTDASHPRIAGVVPW